MPWIYVMGEAPVTFSSVGEFSGAGRAGEEPPGGGLFHVWWMADSVSPRAAPESSAGRWREPAPGSGRTRSDDAAMIRHVGEVGRPRV